MLNSTLFALLVFAMTSAIGQEHAPYQLGPGDKIAIVVYGEADLSPEVTISQQGAIRYPFLGVLNVAGKTVDDVEAMLLEGLKGPYLIDPKVQVSVVEYRPFYILGEVQKPGSYTFNPGLSVRQAISLAGGMTERGSTRKIFLLREGESEDEVERVGLDYELHAGDTVTIEQSFF